MPPYLALILSIAGYYLGIKLLYAPRSSPDFGIRVIQAALLMVWCVVLFNLSLSNLVARSL